MASSFCTILSQLVRLIKQPPAPGAHQPYPKLRNFILDVMAEGRRKNTINLLFEAELSPIREHLALYTERQGEQLSLTSYIARSLACTVDENKALHAYRHGKSRLVLFDEVDLAVMVEREIDGSSLPIAMLVRSANRKNISEIHHELQSAKTAPLGKHGPMSALEKQFFELPSPLRRIVWFFIRRDPYLFKQLAGTVGITSMGMHSSGSAVLIPITPMTLTLSIGAISKKLVIADGQVVESEVIQMNLGADHDIIDGAPLMRFADRFKQKLRAGCAIRVNALSTLAEN